MTPIKDADKAGCRMAGQALRTTKAKARPRDYQQRQQWADSSKRKVAS